MAVLTYEKGKNPYQTIDIDLDSGDFHYAHLSCEKAVQLTKVEVYGKLFISKSCFISTLCVFFNFLVCVKILERYFDTNAGIISD